MKLPSTSQYWIAPNAINLTLNADGNGNYIQVASPSDAALICYVQDIPELGYDTNHNFKKWLIQTDDACFATDTEKYVYLRIPRTQEAINADPEAVQQGCKAPADQYHAQLCYPSQKIDIYGCTHSNDGFSGDTTTQVGSRSYLYLWMQAVISAKSTNGTRTMTQPLHTGTLSTDVFIKYDGSCTLIRHEGEKDSSTYDLSLDVLLDGRFIQINRTDVPSDAILHTIQIPHPKDYEGQSFKVSFFPAPMEGGRSAITLQSVELSNFDNKSLFYTPYDPSTTASAAGTVAPAYVKFLLLYGACTFTITSFKTLDDEGNDIWVWFVDEVTTYYFYVRSANEKYRAIGASSGWMQQYPPKDITGTPAVGFPGFVTKDGLQLQTTG